jgi:hypothetical protein
MLASEFLITVERSLFKIPSLANAGSGSCEFIPEHGKCLRLSLPEEGLARIPSGPRPAEDAAWSVSARCVEGIDRLSTQLSDARALETIKSDRSCAAHVIVLLAGA